MDAKRYEQIVKKVSYDCSRLNLSEHAEDLAHDVIVKFLSGKNKHSTVGQCLIDCIRKYMGDSRSDNFKLKDSVRNYYELTDENVYNIKEEIIYD